MADVRESQIEDVFATFPSIFRSLANLSVEPRILSRQLPLGSGRLDLLFLEGSRLLLVELKVERFKPEFLDQDIALSR